MKRSVLALLTVMAGFAAMPGTASAGDLTISASCLRVDASGNVEPFTATITGPSPEYYWIKVELSSGTAWSNQYNRYAFGILDESGTTTVLVSSLGPTAIPPDATSVFVKLFDDFGRNFWEEQEVPICGRAYLPTTKDQCKKDGWKRFYDGTRRFKNQGDCVSFVATGGKNPSGARRYR